MKPEIKQRIEQIKAGQVPDGYKRTKAGIVPAEWEEKRIGDVLTQRKTLMCISEDAPLLSFTIEDNARKNRPIHLDTVKAYNFLAERIK